MKAARRPFERDQRPEEKRTKTRLHNLVLCQTGWLLAFHHVIVARGAGVHVLDESDAEGTAAVLVAGELGWNGVSVGFSGNGFFVGSVVILPIEVSAVSGVSNWTTPVPRERPLGSY